MKAAFKAIGIISLLILTASCGGRGGDSATTGGRGGSSTAGGSGGTVPVNSVSGTVTFNGSPLAGVTVTAFNTNTNTVFHVTTTDAAGNYSMSGFSTSSQFTPNYQFWAEKSGYAFYPSVGSGANVTRFDYTGQYLTIIGIYKTVINYNSEPNASLTGANFIAYNGANPLVSLAATGQGTSYAAGDDASSHKGVGWPASRFVDNRNGTVTDNLTGLVWLKNAGCFNPTVWTTALTDVNRLADGACGLTDGSAAGQWHLPNINELESIVDVSGSNPAIPAGSPFTNVSPGIYWSSTTYFGLSTSAWSIRFSDGRYMNDVPSNVKSVANNGVWAVRSGTGGSVKLQATGQYVVFAGGDDAGVDYGVPLTYPRMVDNGDGTITDTMTGLIWLKRGDCINQTWSAALAAVNGLASGQCGLTDGSAAGSWRMPNRNEMISLSDRALGNHADYFDTKYVNTVGVGNQSPIFDNFAVSQYYWTSTTDASDPTKAWTVYSCDFGVYDMAKTVAGFTLAVRSR